MQSRCDGYCYVPFKKIYWFLVFKTEVFFFIIQAIKPTVLIGTSGVGQTFTQEVVETMAELNEVLFWYIHFVLGAHVPDNRVKLGVCRNPSSFLFQTQLLSQNVQQNRLISGVR